ncbi:MAG: hypothetical protein GY719_31565 [bacterium]|nr:hypothetical protein [bacterium]
MIRLLLAVFGLLFFALNAIVRAATTPGFRYRHRWVSWRRLRRLQRHRPRRWPAGSDSP